MKKYIEYKNVITDEEGTLNIPKDPSNRHYQQFLEEQKRREAELIPYIPPALTWEQIKAERNQLLLQSDWTDLPNTPLANKEAWLNYRQALRDVTKTFSKPEDVIWPQKPIA
jgi:hypothetical protein